MAITIVGTTLTSFGNNGGNATINLSSLGLQENDVVFVSSAAPRVTGATPAVVTSGYSPAVTAHLGSTSNRPSIGVWYKVMGATPDGSVEVSGDTSSTTDTTIIAIALRGVDTSNVLDQTSTTAGETSSTNPDPPAIVTQTNGAWVLVWANTIVLDSIVLPPTNYENATLVNGNDTVDHTHLLATREITSAGTENPGVFNGVDSGYWYAITVAVRPLTSNTYEDALSLGISKSITDRVNLTGLGSISLSTIKNILNSSNAELPVSINLAINKSSVFVENSTLESSILLEKLSDLSFIGGVSFEGNISLDKNVVIAEAGKVNPFVILSDSVFISGSASTSTTYQLTPPGVKTTGSFQSGYISDDTNPLPSLDLASDTYTEVEWSIEFTDDPEVNDVYEFRVTISGVPVDTYTETPQITITLGAQTYEDSLILAKTLAISFTNVLEILSSLSLDKYVNISLSALADFGTSLSLSKTLGISVDNVLIIEALISIAKQLDISIDNVITKEALLSLDKQLGITSDTVLDITALLTLDKVLDISVLSNIELFETLSLIKTLSASFTGGLDVNAVVSLSKILAILTASDTSTEVAIQLAKQLDISADSILTAECLVSLDKTLDISVLSNVDLYELVTLSKTLVISVEGGRSLEAVLTLSKILAILTNYEVLVNVYNEALELTKNLGVSSSITLDREGNILLNKVLDFTTTSQADLLDSIELIKTISIINSSNVDFSVQLDLGKVIAVSVSGGLTLEQSIALGRQLEVLFSSIITQEAYLSLSKELALQNTALISTDSQIILAKDLAVDFTTQVDFAASISLDKVVLIRIDGGLAYDDAITLGYNLLIELDEAVIPQFLEKFGTVTINDVKYVMVIIGDE